jgi:hypothetical protein
MVIPLRCGRYIPRFDDTRSTCANFKSPFRSTGMTFEKASSASLETPESPTARSLIYGIPDHHFSRLGRNQLLCDRGKTTVNTPPTIMVCTRPPSTQRIVSSVCRSANQQSQGPLTERPFHRVSSLGDVRSSIRFLVVLKGWFSSSTKHHFL